ncbi:putative methyltransferase [Talaromyces proteolyticus]|uniref:Methyltransferase n=1 Tax=Talaromyces proteolyticus TaxID=1131652 RepID=A0AAD4L0F6_9EURO|nr:putative methyltransferase [Talaromyces proteolyticus]KAH8705242.1 putative methyltransferase [Talaromyces proteolyticus]
MPYHHPPIPVDGSHVDDRDSTYDGSIAETSESLRSSIFHYEYENGRRYHAFREGSYAMPNDETEQARLDLQHHIFLLCLGGRLHLAPIRNPQRILDVGTGTGIWAIEFADEFPSAVVIGTDLSPIQPSFVPPNLKFYVDDFELPWDYDEQERFDYIHWRALSGSTNNWPRLYKQAYESLKPGGYIEVHEYDPVVYSEDDRNLLKAPWTKEWLMRLCEASARNGKPIDVGRHQRQLMHDTGFVDLTEKIVKVPIGQWARDPSLKEIGGFERLHVNESVEAHSLALFTRVLGYSYDQASILFSMVRNELNDRSLHLYTVYRFLVGRKPVDA